MAKVKSTLNIELRVTGNADDHHVRKLSLTGPSYAIRVGRGSRNGEEDLIPNGSNAWFDSRVMSRVHAVIKASPDMQAVFVEDIGSTHGTFVNQRKIGKEEKAMLKTGDSLRFGAEVSRGPVTFPALCATIHYDWTSETRGNFAEEIRSVFEVSDDEESDIEIVKESTHTPKPPSRAVSQTFSVPGSELSAAGSFDSDGNDSDVHEVDNYMPSSARTMMKGLVPISSKERGPEVAEIVTSDEKSPESSQEHQVAGIEAAVPETVPDSIIADTNVDAPTTGLENIKHVTILKPIKQTEVLTSTSHDIDENLTDSDYDYDSDESANYDRSRSQGSDDPASEAEKMDEHKNSRTQSVMVAEKAPEKTASQGISSSSPRSSPLHNSSYDRDTNLYSSDSDDDDDDYDDYDDGYAPTQPSPSPKGHDTRMTSSKGASADFINFSSSSPPSKSPGVSGNKVTRPTIPPLHYVERSPSSSSPFSSPIDDGNGATTSRLTATTAQESSSSSDPLYNANDTRAAAPVLRYTLDAESLPSFSTLPHSGRAPSPSDAAMPKPNVFNPTNIPSQHSFPDLESDLFYEPSSVNPGHPICYYPPSQTSTANTYPAYGQGSALNPWAVPFNPTLTAVPNGPYPNGPSAATSSEFYNNMDVHSPSSTVAVCHGSPGNSSLHNRLFDSQLHYQQQMQERARSLYAQRDVPGSTPASLTAHASYWDKLHVETSSTPPPITNEKVDLNNTLQRLIARTSNNSQSHPTIPSTSDASSSMYPSTGLWKSGSSSTASTGAPSGVMRLATKDQGDKQVHKSVQTSKPNLKRKADLLDLPNDVADEPEAVSAPTELTTARSSEKAEKAVLRPVRDAGLTDGGATSPTRSTEDETQDTRPDAVEDTEPPRKKVKTTNKKAGPTYGRYAAFTVAGAVLGVAGTFASLLALPKDIFAP